MFKDHREGQRGRWGATREVRWVAGGGQGQLPEDLGCRAGSWPLS